MCLRGIKTLGSGQCMFYLNMKQIYINSQKLEKIITDIIIYFLSRIGALARLYMLSLRFIIHLKQNFN